MFTFIRIKNIGGINNEICLDFKAPPKKKDKKNTVKTIDTYTDIDKIIGIIGPNSSGKSSIIDALVAFRIFLGKNKILDLVNSNKDFSLDNYSDSYFLPIKNLESLDDESLLSFEIFIPIGKKPGLYTYELRYVFNRKSNDFNYSINECLSYKKKSNSTKVYKIEDHSSDVPQSDIGYKCYYKDSILSDYQNVSKELVKAFQNKMDYYDTFYNYIMSSACSFDSYGYDIINSDYRINFIEKNTQLISEFLSIVDPKIKEVFVESNPEDDTKEAIFKTIHGSELIYKILSTGTKKMLDLLIKIYDKINNYGIIVCDEIDSSLHKELIQFIASLFLRSDSYCQLIFTTLNPEILEMLDLRNDQKFFIGNTDGKINVFRVSDINSRKDYSFSKNYYTDSRYSPQPSKSQIIDFCEKYISTTN